MVMKIGKRILAGTLALMSGLSCISAQEHESQDVPQKTVQKESVHDSVKKWSYSNVLKGTALGCVIGGITGGIYWYVVNRKDEIDETRVRLRRASNKVLYYYACPAMRNHIEKLSKDEIYLENVKCLEAFTYLFKFLDGDEDRDDRRIRESLECIVSGTHQELDIELSKFDMNSTNSRGAESDALTVDLLNNLTRLNKFIYGEPKDLLSV